jgi:hypothetical protein
MRKEGDDRDARCQRREQVEESGSIETGQKGEV